jgi:hypothetical protein
MLERLMGDEELAGTILRGFLADMPRQIEAPLRALAYELEQAGKARELESMKARMDELHCEFERLKSAMKEEGEIPCHLPNRGADHATLSRVIQEFKAREEPRHPADRHCAQHRIHPGR